MNIYFDFNHLSLRPDLTFLCDRNADMVILESMGIKNPIAYTQSGLFVDDISFAENGVFHTFFGRDTFIKPVSLLIGEKTHGLDWTVIIKNLQNGCPTIIMVDVYFLDYKQHYLKEHGAHNVILSDYNKFNENFFVIDWYEPDYYKGWLPKNKLEKARMSDNGNSDLNVFSRYSIKSTYKIVHSIDQSVIENINLNEIIVKNIKKTIFYLTKFIESDDSLSKEMTSQRNQWIHNFYEEYYFNALESFFYLELEIKYFTLYLSQIEYYFSFKSIFEELIETNEALKKYTQIIKLKLHKSIIKKETYNSDDWDLNISQFSKQSYELLLKLNKFVSGVRLL